ncbi:centrosome-associated protein ALMS1 isoform X3 [Trichomycterus rosablanca]|uniref:centrosome-associated protein ALMS1 isoform X3 n=1 Tax=Trichomycterus rosablanca TaxID=2290929 RepID=UPI002F357AA8
MSIVQDTSMQPVADRFASLQLAELQDSCLSPVLTLIPQGKTFIPSESTLLHQTELDFAPLRGSPDLSVFLERCPRMSHLDVDTESNHPDRSLEQASLSQHPLGVTTAILEDVSSCCSLSQHSLSPNSDYQASWVHEKKFGKKYEKLLDGEFGDSVSKLQKYVGVASSDEVTLVSKNAFSQTGAAPVALNTPEEQSKHCNPTCKDDSDFRAAEKLQVRLSGGRKQPQGGCSSSVSHRKTMGSVETSLSSRMSAISNITVRFARMQPDETTDFRHRQLELQSDAAISTLGSINQIENKIPSSAQYVSSASLCEPGLTRAPKNSARHPTADGFFLTSQPVSQSTPAVLFGRGAPVLTELTPIYSQQNTEATSAINQIPALDLSNTNPLTIPDVSHATSLDPAETQKVSNIYSEKQLNQEASSPKIYVLALTREDASFEPHTQSIGSTSQSTSDRELSNQELMLSSRRVHSLPSLSSLQKVDAWKASQSSSRSFHDLALQGFAGVSPKRKAQDSASETVNIILSPQSLENPSRAVNVSGLRHRNMAEAGGVVQPTPASPLTHSHSHLSLGTVIVPVQQDDTQIDLQLPPVRSLAITQGNNSTAAESSDERMADRSKTNPVKTPSLIGLGHFGDLPTNPSMISSLPSFKGSCYGEQSFHESVGAASSVVSLEVDNYAPYWTSRPSSPQRSFELNIEDRIPLYLRNLGIDQSPSAILNPFTRRGPIREPEFSPTDLCTIKDSVGTPTKSTLPSEGDSPRKATFSSSSVLSSDSNSSLTQQVQKPDRPASPGSVRMIRCQTSTPPKSQTSHHACSVPKESDAPQREGSYGLPAQLSLDSGPPPGTCLEVREGDSSLVGSATLQEIRHLLGRAESLVSAQSSLTSSPGSHFYSESDASLLSLRQDTHMCHDDSSLSTGGRNSSVLARSSSDSALKQSSSSSCGAPRLSTPSHHMTNAPLTVGQSREENLKSRDLDVAPRRAEPEGCSAADPDRVGPVSLSVKKMNAITTSYDQQQSQDSAEDAGVSSSIVSPSHSSAEMELGTPLGSDSGSDCSLAARVAKLLQSESSVSVITSRPSTTDTEKSRAGAEVMVKVSGGECKATGLNTEDRKRIEEIKRELLLHTKSSDSESSIQSSVGTLSWPTVGFAAVRSAEDRLTEQFQRASKTSLAPTVPSHIPTQPSLEDRVCQIAFREGISLTPPLPSVSTATIRQTPSPQPTSQRLHVHDGHGTHEDAVPDKKSHQLMSSGKESKLQTQGPDKTIEKEGMGIVEKDNERKAKNEHQENKRPDALAVQEGGIKDITVEREIPPGLESASPSAHKAHMSDIHLNLSSNPKQKTTQTRTGDASTYSQLQNGPHAHQSDKMFSQSTLKNVPSPVFNTSKEQNPTVSSEISSSKDNDMDQNQNTGIVGGYSQKSYRHQQAYMNAQTLAGSSRALSVQAAAIPTLLPYKPHGSSELFYMPKTDQELSPNTSETTMESSHPGSDDAVPPRFSTEVLGSREIQDRNVTPKHKEGIYSKRVKMNRESTVSGKGFCDSKVAFSQKDCIGPVYQLTSSNFSGEPVNNQVAIHITEQNEKEEDGFVQLNMEADYSTDDQHYHSNTVRKQNLPPETLSLPTKAARNVGEDRKVRDISVEIGSSLDQLWHRFNRSYSLQESRPLNEGEVSLLERLERLSRLLHSPALPHTSAKQAGSQVENGKNMRRDPEMRNVQNKEVNTKEKKERSRRVKNIDEVKRLPKTAWEDKALRTSKALVEDVQQENDHRYPAERDESASVSVETSSSRSTIDTQRLLRAFGPLRVSSGGEESTKQTSGSLLKVYNTIHKQKTGNGKAHSKHHLVSVATETSSTDESRASFGTLSSSSTYSLPSQRGTRGCSSKRRKVKLVSRGIQAGDLEIVVNGTRRHTRDVGTTFPSPGCAKDIRAPAANSVSWFVSADEMKVDARKENKPQSDSLQFKNQAWFEPYSRVQPWREPLRERHIQEQRETPPEHTTSSENGTSHKPSALVYLSLQEALEFHRPGFVSRSRERMKRLCLLAEERKMQAVYNKEREELFNQPLQIQRPAAVSASAAPPAPAPSKRVIPVSEMVQRSKRIYSQLPEVQKRKEEERRKMEYRTYRLNAQLFNKKITNRVLGKRAPWQ